MKTRQTDDVFSNGVSNGASVDAAFRKIQKHSTAFHIWRVENMNVIALPKDQYGTFYDTDSYVVYSAAQYGRPMGVETIPRESRGVNLEYHIHFWLGSETTADKSGVAAYKSVELDNFIGGISVQHRETQGNECSRFKSYFRSGFKVLNGNRIGDCAPIFYRVQGKRCPILTELPCIEWKYFNSKHIFLICTSRTIFIWVGRAASVTEKMQSARIALQIKEERGMRCIVFVDDGYEQTLLEEDKQELNKYLPLDKKALSLQALEDDTDEELYKHKTVIRLYKCSDNNGKYRVAEVKLSPLDLFDLNSDNVYILDHGYQGIWVWVGRRANEKERVEALRNARGFVKKKRYPNNTKVTRVVEGYESLEFKALFNIWKEKEDTKTAGKIQTANKPARIALTRFDGDYMNDRIFLAAETQLIDDGSGILKVWKIKNNDVMELAKERYGNFYSGECYILLYSYEVNSKLKYIIYYWLGLLSSEREYDTTILKTIELNKECGEASTAVVRVFEEYEPAHFLQLFKGKMVAFKDAEKNLKNSLYLLKIFGMTSYSSKAVQVACKASVLNSNFCYVLKRGKRSFIWCGTNSTGDQREMAKGFAGKDFELILEGKEREQFWDLLGGKATYVTEKILIKSDETRIPRLFYFSRRNDGLLEIDEVLNYTQTDLLSEEIMLLDAYGSLFVWIGSFSSIADHKTLLEMVEEYILIDPAGRNIHTPVFMIKENNEPPNFKGYFDAWDNKNSQKYQTFENIRRKIQQNTVKNPVKDMNSTAQSHVQESFDRYDKYPLHILKAPNDKLPSKINPLNKELHLTHDDFVMLFNIKYGEFEKLPRWKQQEMKKKVGLF